MQRVYVEWGVAALVCGILWVVILVALGIGR